MTELFCRPTTGSHGQRTLSVSDNWRTVKAYQLFAVNSWVLGTHCSYSMKVTHVV